MRARKSSRPLSILVSLSTSYISHVRKRTLSHVNVHTFALHARNAPRMGASARAFARRTSDAMPYCRIRMCFGPASVTPADFETWVARPQQPCYNCYYHDHCYVYDYNCYYYHYHRCCPPADTVCQVTAATNCSKPTSPSILRGEVAAVASDGAKSDVGRCCELQLH